MFWIVKIKNACLILKQVVPFLICFGGSLYVYMYIKKKKKLLHNVCVCVNIYKEEEKLLHNLSFTHTHT